VLGVVLAGGASRRFGADKRAALLADRPLLEWVAERAGPQVDTLLVNANDADVGGTIPQIARLADDAPGEGPLPGILAALAEAERRMFSHVASFACDTPFFPEDTVAQLSQALWSSRADFSAARCGSRIHHIFALWPVACRVPLEAAFAGGLRGLRDIQDRLTPAWADFPAMGGPKGDPFFNINTRADLETAEIWLQRPHST
jgi:molybdopterin-guanine dinucleotide biosynthesis protein A